MTAIRSHVELRHPLLQRLAEARVQTDELFALVRPDSLYERPIPERHRIIFYIGHLEAFDLNLLRERVLNLESFRPEFDKLFAFGIDPVGGGLPTDQPSDWPTLQETRSYVDRVRQAVDAGLGDALLADDRKREFPVTLLLNVAIEHRLMHAETLAYMLHQLPIGQKIRPSGKPELITAANHTQPSSHMLKIPSGVATIGQSRSAGAFGWDNEFEPITVDVPGFEIDQYKVTNAQFLEFIVAGGYDNRTLWTDADWDWKTKQKISHPVFWKAVGGMWFLRTMFDEIPLPLDWPVYVSHAEASACARWAGKWLPTEAQWHRAAYGTAEGSEQTYPWGSGEPNPEHGNFDFHDWDPTSVSAHPEGSSAFGVAGLLGNGWEWTSSKFAPLPGFQAFPFYPGYSADFFDGKHYVMKGGSSRTAACMLRRSFRNWFQAHYQYAYVGFRCVRN